MKPGAPMGGRPVRVLLADDAAVVRRGLADLLGEIDGVQIVGETEDAPSTLALIEERQPDLVVLDLRMPGGGGLAVLEGLRNRPRRPVVVVLTNYPEPAYRESCLTAGADHFLDKSTQFNQVADIVRDLARRSRPAAATPANAMKRILVVDDSPTLRRMVITSLQSLGEVEFDQAGTGLEAIERLALQPADLMVLDLNMPDMHGFEVLQFLRSHQAYKTLPVLVLTTRGDEASRRQALSAGAAAYMTKPFTPPQLLDCVRQLLGTV